MAAGPGLYVAATAAMHRLQMWTVVDTYVGQGIQVECASAQPELNNVVNRISHSNGTPTEWESQQMHEHALCAMLLATLCICVIVLLTTAKFKRTVQAGVAESGHGRRPAQLPEVCLTDSAHTG